MRTKKPWMTLLALLAALSLVAAACSDDDGDDTATTDTEETTSDEGSETTAADEGTETTEAMAEDEEATDVPEPVGEACAAIPADGEGSSAGMADDTAGTAASNNPVLSTLVEAVVAADLVDALNDPEATYTIFAPYNDAFAAIPAADLEALLADTEALTDVLTYHVYADGELSAEDLASETELTMLNGDTLPVAVDGDTVTVGDSASVICGNVTTANATVHIIDSVLMPPA